MRGVVDDHELELLRQRNLQRLQEAKKKLGPRWLLHPANRVTRKVKQ